MQPEKHGYTVNVSQPPSFQPSHFLLYIFLKTKSLRRIPNGYQKTGDRKRRYFMHRFPNFSRVCVRKTNPNVCLCEIRINKDFLLQFGIQAASRVECDIHGNQRSRPRGNDLCIYQVKFHDMQAFSRPHPEGQGYICVLLQVLSPF